MNKRFLFPLVIIAAGLGLATVIIATGPTLEQQPPGSNAPLVRTWRAVAERVQLTSVTYGTVLPRTASELIPEVSGRVTGISPNMVSGGFFKEGDLLLEIDPLDYEVALEQAKANLASARSDLDNAERAYKRQQDLAKKQSTSQSQRDDALNKLRVTQAALLAANARLSRAQRDLDRTRITAPYDGRVRSERVDIGQFVTRGRAVASLYATDVAEVRLPIHDEELAYLELPLVGIPEATQPRVILRARFAGEEHTWEGKVVRTEGELDPQTRMINVIAQVHSPYDQGSKPPLAVGLFVEAEIVGNQVDKVFVLPRSALQANRQIYVLSRDNRLEFRDVEILRIVGEQVYVQNGINPGETICLSTVDNAVAGMRVRPADETGLAAS